MKKTVLFTGLIATTASLLAGCFHKTTPADPYENYNRAMFAFNTDLDHLFLRPVAQTYNFIMPHPAQTGVKNFFDNLDEVTSVPNDALQGKFLFMLNDFWRVLINTTAGIGGLFDVAKHMGLRPHYENFGLTIAYWEGGNANSSYFVLPLFGAGTIQSAVGKAVDLPTTPYIYIPGKYWYVGVGLRGLEAVNYRAELLPANSMLDNAFDPYVFMRNAYLQSMRKRIEDNQKETFNSQHISGRQAMTVASFEHAQNSMQSGSVEATNEEKELLFGTNNKNK